MVQLRDEIQRTGQISDVRGDQYWNDLQALHEVLQEDHQRREDQIHEASIENPPNDNTIRGSWPKGWNKQEARFFKPSKSYKIGPKDIYKTMSLKPSRLQ